MKNNVPPDLFQVTLREKIFLIHRQNTFLPPIHFDFSKFHRLIRTKFESVTQCITLKALNVEGRELNT